MAAAPVSAFNKSGCSAKNEGCEFGVSGVRLWQYSGDTVTNAVGSANDAPGFMSGRRTKHCAPLRELIRSNSDGPKNHAANTAHTRVVAIHRATRLVGRWIDVGVVKKIPKNAIEVQPQAFFTKYTLKTFDFWAKYDV